MTPARPGTVSAWEIKTVRLAQHTENAGKENRMEMGAVFLDKLEKEFLKIRSIFATRG